MCYFIPVFYSCKMYDCPNSYLGVFVSYVFTQEFGCRGICRPGIGNMLPVEFLNYPCMICRMSGS